MEKQSHLEIWKPVPGYAGIYEISDIGRLQSLDGSVKSNGGKRPRKGQIIKTWLWNGYERAHLSKGNTRKNVSIHRLVAEAFIPNPQNKATVNHMNGIKTDNRASNLEWHSVAENLDHARASGLRNDKQACKKVVDNCTNQVFSSINEAALANNISYHQCRRWIKAGKCLQLAA